MDWTVDTVHSAHGHYQASVRSLSQTCNCMGGTSLAKLVGKMDLIESLRYETIHFSNISCFNGLLLFQMIGYESLRY